MTYSIYHIYLPTYSPCPVDAPERNTVKRGNAPNLPPLPPKHVGAEGMKDARVHASGKTKARSQGLTRCQGREERRHHISLGTRHVFPEQKACDMGPEDRKTVTNTDYRDQPKLGALCVRGGKGRSPEAGVPNPWAMDGYQPTAC